MTSFFVSPYEGDITRVSKKQRYILVHSYLYYKIGSPVITDLMYDKAMYDLKEEISRLSQYAFSKTDYYYVFSDFDPSTGFDLVDRLCENDLKWICMISDQVLMSRVGD